VVAIRGKAEVTRTSRYAYGVESAVCSDNAQVLIENQERIADRIYDRPRGRVRFIEVYERLVVRPRQRPLVARSTDSNPPKQHEDDNDNQDGADDTDTTVSVAVTVTAEAALKPPSKKMMRMIRRMSPSDMIISSFALGQLKPDAEAKAVQNCSHQKAWGLRRSAVPPAHAKIRKFSS